MELRADFTLGFFGGGQLARMSAYQAYRFGIQTAVYVGKGTPEPMSYVTPSTVQGGSDDFRSMADFARPCDVVTLENEFIDAALLHRIREESGTPMFPTPETFALIGDKRTEKETFERAGIPVTPWAVLPDADSAAEFGGRHGFPFVVKSSKGGYDGYGNATVRNGEEAREAWAKLGGSAGREVIAEAFVDFRMELAVQVARNHTGTVVYRCCESINEGHICKTVIVPARISPQLQYQAEQLALAAVEAIDGIGQFAFEFFLTGDDRILLNESAPRPHNTGHYSIEGCVTSQFENHVRAVLGLPLGSTALRRPAAVMVNLLGKRKHPAVAENIADAMATPDAHLHIYGKLDGKPGRKMGHLTLLGDDVEATLAKATALEAAVLL